MVWKNEHFDYIQQLCLCRRELPTKNDGEYLGSSTMI